MDDDNDKYIIVVAGEDVEIDKDSILGKCKEFVDHWESELIKLYKEAEEEYRNTVQWSVDDNGSITVDISHLVKTDAFKQTIEDFVELENNLNKSS